MRLKTHISDKYVMLYESNETEELHQFHQFFISKWHEFPVVASFGDMTYLSKWMGYS